MDMLARPAPFIMPLNKEPNTANTIELTDGHAERMDDGVFVVIQRDHLGAVNDVVMTRADLERLLAA